MDRKETASEEMERAYLLLKEYSRDSQHYLSFKEENQYFFGERVCGMVSYVRKGKKIMSIGDPVCRPEDMERLTCEYLQFCRENKWKPVFNTVSGSIAEILKKQGFSVMKYGEEAVLELSGYNLAGGKRAALRRNVSKVEKSGVTLREYSPQKKRDKVPENRCDDRSNGTCHYCCRHEAQRGGCKEGQLRGCSTCRD